MNTYLANSILLTNNFTKYVAALSDHIGHESFSTSDYPMRVSSLRLSWSRVETPA
jgi:hypothetical protein